MSNVQLVGVKPESVVPERGSKYPIIHCGLCGKAIVWGWDDMFPDEGSPLYRRQFDFDPSEYRNGDVILWYAVDGAGFPVGQQMFKRIADAPAGYKGSTWFFHASTCTGVRR